MLGAAARAVRSRILTALGARVRSPERLRSRITPLTLPLEPDESTGFKFHHQYRGSTANVDLFSCHASVLSRGIVRTLRTPTRRRRS